MAVDGGGNSTNSRARAFIDLIIGLLLIVALACGSCRAASDPPSEDGASCLENPSTHVEIINSCADVVSFDKPALLPKFAPGAPLVPLP